MTADPLAVLRQADPAPCVTPYDAARTSALLDRAIASAPGAHRGPGADPARRRRRSQAAGAALGAALLAGGGGAAYAVLYQPASSALGLECSAGTSQQEFQQAGGNLSSYVGASSGDPVADCAAEYDRLEVVAPPLRGYTTGENYLSIVPKGWPVPSNWHPLDVDFRNDSARLELSQRLGDVLDGPQSRCRSAEAVEAIVRRDLADLGMTGWTIKRLEQAERADGQDWCALAFLEDTGVRVVQIQGLPGPATGEVPAEDPFGRILQTLRRDITDQCLPLPDARQVAEQAIRDAGFDPARHAQVTVIEDAAAACTRVDVPLAGLIDVTLRGPAAPSPD